jgi:hypothetical protein
MPRYKVNASISLLALILAVPLIAAKLSSPAAAADSFEQKVALIQENAQRPEPDATPTRFAEEEVNAYFAERRLPKMPDGVKTVRFELAPSEVTAYTTVDFDDLRKGSKSNNPLLALFTGQHDMVVVANTEPAGPGRVRVRVESVELDGVSVPKMALEFFIDRYVKPKYPNVSLDNEYALPARIESAEIRQDLGIIIQK